MQTNYKRVLLKLTGELFGTKGIDFDKVEKVAKYLVDFKNRDGQIELAIVLGGGNIFRGKELNGSRFDKVTADYIGMTATILNGLALQGMIQKVGGKAIIMSSYKIGEMTEVFSRQKAIEHLNNKEILILAGGTGNPFFTTDSGAALRACELDCEIILKGSNVDGIYSDDPKINPSAKKYETLTYDRAIEEKMAIMDNTAFALCKNQKIPIIVFNVNELDNIEKIINGEKIGTLVN